MKVVQIAVVVLFVALSISEGKKYKEGDCEGVSSCLCDTGTLVSVCVFRSG